MRVLIDWDWAANGVWRIGPHGTTAALFMPDWLVDRVGPPGGRRPNVWRDRLPADLRGALRDWNERGERLFGARQDGPAHLSVTQEWFHQAVELAAAVQSHLGPECEVLYVRADGAWGWVTPPWQRT